VNAEEVIALLEGAGDEWPSVVAEHGWVIEARNDEHLRDRVLAEGHVLYRVEFPDRWHALGWSDASKGLLRRDVPLSMLARWGARSASAERPD